MLSEIVQLEFMGVPPDYLKRSMIDDPNFMKQVQQGLGWRNIHIGPWVVARPPPSVNNNFNSNYPGAVQTTATTTTPKTIDESYMERWSNYLLPIQPVPPIIQSFISESTIPASSVSRMTAQCDSVGNLKQVQVVTETFFNHSVLSNLASTIVMDVVGTEDGGSSIVSITLSCDYCQRMPIITSVIEKVAIRYALRQMSTCIKEVEKQFLTANVPLTLIHLTKEGKSSKC